MQTRSNPKNASRLACGLSAALATLLCPGLNAAEQKTNAPAAVATAPVKTDYQSFKLISERNIFNANRYGGRSDDAPPAPKITQVDSFALLGTLDYPKGQVAFFDGSSSSYRRAFKPEESIGGYKITGINPGSVSLEAEGKQTELKVGFQMRRENQGQWQVQEWTPPRDEFASRSSDSESSTNRPESSDSRYSRDSRSSRDSRYGSSDSRYSRDSRYGSSDSRSSRDSRYGSSDSRSSRDYRSSSSDSRYSSGSSGSNSSSTTPGSSSTSSGSSSGGDQSEILKRLMQQREQENKK